MSFIIKAKVLITVCASEHHWLDRNYIKGEELFVYEKYTFGLISKHGVACTLRKGEEPFFEMPRKSIMIYEITDEF